MRNVTQKGEEMAIKRTELIGTVPGEGKIVSMIEHKGRIIVATETRLFTIQDKIITPLKLIYVEEED